MANEVTFRFVVPPLQINPSLDVVQDLSESDGVPGIQTYDSLGGWYDPDYSLYPLVLQPQIFAYDPSGQLSPTEKDITKDMTNITWEALGEGSPLRIDPSNSDYEVTTSGNNAGRIKVKRNVSPTQPLTLRYKADYLDTRTGDVYPVTMEMEVRCRLEKKEPVLKLDVPAQHFYNPFKSGLLKINASIFSGKNEVLAGSRKCVWEILDGGVWYAPGSRPSLLFASVSEDTMTLELNMEFMGETANIRCHGIVSENPEELAGKTAADAFGSRSVRLTRRLPRFRSSIFSMPTQIPRTQQSISPKAHIDFENTVVDNPEKEIQVEWRTGSGVAGNATQQLTKVATGMQPTIKADKIAATYGQVLQMTPVDRGAWKLLTDGSGNIITDGQGRPIMVR